MCRYLTTNDLVYDRMKQFVQHEQGKAIWQTWIWNTVHDIQQRNVLVVQHLLGFKTGCSELCYFSGLRSVGQLKSSLLHVKDWLLDTLTASVNKDQKEICRPQVQFLLLSKVVPQFFIKGISSHTPHSKNLQQIREL